MTEEQFFFVQIWLKDSKTFANIQLWYMVNSISSLLVWEEIGYTVHVALPKQPINHFKPVQQSRQQELRSYCPNILQLWACKYSSHELRDAMSGGKDNSLGVMCLRGDSISKIYTLKILIQYKNKNFSKLQEILKNSLNICFF